MTLSGTFNVVFVVSVVTIVPTFSSLVTDNLTVLVGLATIVETFAVLSTAKCPDSISILPVISPYSWKDSFAIDVITTLSAFS